MHKTNYFIHKKQN